MKKLSSILLALSALWVLGSSLWLVERFFAQSANTHPTTVAEAMSLAGKAMQIYLWPAVLLCVVMALFNLWLSLRPATFARASTDPCPAADPA